MSFGNCDYRIFIGIDENIIFWIDSHGVATSLECCYGILGSFLFFADDDSKGGDKSDQGQDVDDGDVC